MALLMTMNNEIPLPEVEELHSPKPRNQWHEQLLIQAGQPPVSHKHWPTQSQARVEPCRGYEFSKNGGHDGSKSISGGRNGYDWSSNAK